MYYKLFIEGDSGEKIEITDHTVIQNAEFNLYQNDKLANDRSDQLFADVTVCGVLNDKSKNETKAISEWARKTDKANIYKKVDITVYESPKDSEPIRDYFFKFMFCSSYYEKFLEHTDNENSGAIGTFCLKMKQRKGEIDTIKVE